MHSAAARNLVDALAEALHRADIASQVVNSSAEFSDIPWQFPPLICEDTLLGAPISDYLDGPLKVDETKAELFYSSCLWHLSVDPSKVYTRGAWKGLAELCKGSQFCDRSYRFAPPLFDEESRPSPQAGQFFALDMAKLVMTSFPGAELTEGENTYFATCHIRGRPVRFGVCDGFPTGDTEGRWDIPLESAPTYLYAPRGPGEISHLTGSVMHRARNALYATLHSGDPIHEFAGMDWALQVLHIQGSSAAESRLMNQLVKSSTRIGQEQFTAKRNLQAWESSLALMEAPSMTDRTKIQQLRLQLVPEILTEGAFAFKVYDLRKSQVPMFHEKTVKRIKDFFRKQIDNERARIK